MLFVSSDLISAMLPLQMLLLHFISCTSVSWLYDFVSGETLVLAFFVQYVSIKTKHTFFYAHFYCL